MSSSDPYGGSLVHIGEPQPIPPGECVCPGIGNTISWFSPNCPLHTECPVFTQHQFDLLEAHWAYNATQVWNVIEAQKDVAFFRWKPLDVRPAYVVGQGLTWVCARLTAGSREQRPHWAEFLFATIRGGCYRFDLPTRRLVPADWAESTASYVDRLGEVHAGGRVR